MRKIFAIFIFTGLIMASSLPKYESITLENGLEVVAIPMQNGSDVISSDIFYKVGSRNEVMGKSGIAHMLEHMNFKSTKNLRAGEFDEEVKSIGGVNNASTGFDYTHYFIKSSSKNLDKSLSLFAELMENLNLKNDEFQPERDVVAEERRWRTENNPMGYLYFRLFNTAFVHHPYHWTPIGFMDDIQNWSINDIKEFHETFYQPSNAIVVVTGDISADEVFKTTKKYFSHIKNTKPIPKQFITEPPQDGARFVELHKESEVEMLAISFPIPNFTHRDQPKLSAMSELLSSGKSSILQKKLVDEKRLVNQIYAYNMENIDAGVYIFLAVCNSGVDAKEIERELWTIIEELKQKDVSQKELDKLKINTKTDFIYSLESASSVANLFGSYLARGDISPLLQYEDAINNLSAKDIKEVANRYLNKNSSTTIILKKGE